MSYEYDKNVYYHPEKCGLEIIDSLDEDGLSYEYNTFIAVRHIESGRVFTASDSGCSCPTPFERVHFNSPEDTEMDEVHAYSWNDFVSTVRSWAIGYNDEQRVPKREVDDFIEEVRLAMKGRP